MSSVARWIACLVAALLTTALAGPAAAAPPKRIVALTPFSANTLVELGVRPIAIGQSPGGRSRFDSSLRKVRSLPLAHPNGPNMEQLASLRPGLVFSSPTWRKGARTMRSLDIRVRESDPRYGRDLYDSIEEVAGIVDREAAGRRLIRRIERKLARATAGYKSRPRVMLVLGVGRTPYVFLENSWGGDLLQRAGARLVTADAESSSGFARISDEVVVQEDPDIIIGVPHARSDDLDGIRRYMQSNQTWRLTSAGQNDRIYVSSDDSLLQADIDIAETINRVRSRYLKNK
jgi:iron complex transport system substrate-binding protein